MNLDILGVFHSTIDKHELRAYFDCLKRGSVVGGAVGFLIGLKAGNSLAGTLLGGLGGVLISAETGLANEYAKTKALQFEKQERKRLVLLLSCRLPEEGEAIHDLQHLATNELYALSYFFAHTPKTLSEQAMLNVLLNQIQTKHPNLFNALKND